MMGDPTRIWRDTKQHVTSSTYLARCMTEYITRQRIEWVIYDSSTMNSSIVAAAISSGIPEQDALGYEKSATLYVATLPLCRFFAECLKLSAAARSSGH
jgi:hypothetical protein